MPITRTVQQLHDLTGRTALVTGGSRGLFRAMAIRSRAEQRTQKVRDALKWSG